MQLSVVMPVRNEAGNILPLLDEVRAALDGLVDYEVVIVDDGSDDGSDAEIREAVAKFDNVRMVGHDAPAGKSRALINGAKSARGRFMATMDGDGQDDPENVAAMWRRLVEGGEPDDDLVVCGWRTNRKDTAWKRSVSKLANGLRKRLLKDATPDTACGLKLFNREAFLELPRFENMHRFFPALFLRQGREVVSVPVTHRDRNRGRSKYGTWDRAWAGLWDLLGVMWLLRRTKYPRIRVEE